MERAGRLVGKMNLPPQVADAESRARAAWPVAAGKRVARYTKATALVRGTLVVEVGDLIWQIRKLGKKDRGPLDGLHAQLPLGRASKAGRVVLRKRSR